MKEVGIVGTAKTGEQAEGSDTTVGVPAVRFDPWSAADAAFVGLASMKLVGDYAQAGKKTTDPVGRVGNKIGSEQMAQRSRHKCTVYAAYILLSVFLQAKATIGRMNLAEKAR